MRTSLEERAHTGLADLDADWTAWIASMHRLVLALLIFMLCAGDAQAYIDGGSAHMIIQGLIAAAVGAAFYLRNPRELWRAIKRRFRRER